MATHAAFLRGINVGGRRVRNDELRGIVERAGVGAAETYRASGNLLLTVDGDPARDDLAAELAGVLEAGLGYPVPTFVRTAAELRAVADRTPFPDAPAGGKVHVAFLRAPLTADEEAELRALLYDTDQVVADGPELHWHMGTGRMMESAMGRPEVERLMGDRWTVRTASTVERMAAKTAA